MSETAEGAAILDLAGLVSLKRFPRQATRVVCLAQVSPDRMDAIREHFPLAEIVSAHPAGNGPWQSAVAEDLRALERVDVLVDRVPVLDCFRAALRDDLSLLRALQWGLGGARTTFLARTGSVAPLVEALQGTGALDPPHYLPEPGGARDGLLARIRRAGVRGVALALSARLDPAHSRRARLARRPRLGAAEAILICSYRNPARAALEAHAALGNGPAVLVRSGPRALSGLEVPRAVRSVPLSAVIALDARRIAALRRDVVPVAMARLERWGVSQEPWAPGPALAMTSLRRAMTRVLLPEVIGAIGAVGAVLRATHAKRVVTGDEFSFVDRAALHLGRALGIETVSRQHGILDSHYLRDTVLASRYLAWDDATIQWLRERGALGPDRIVEALPRLLGAMAPRVRYPSMVAVFLQPFRMVGISPVDWLEETLPGIQRAATAAAAAVVLKPHPLQTRAEVWEDLPAALRGSLRIDTRSTARDLLSTTAVAVTLDSSVAVDCRDAGVPCLSTAWYAGTYREHIARLGYVTPCDTPNALEAAVATQLRLAAAR